MVRGVHTIFRTEETIVFAKSGTLFGCHTIVLVLGAAEGTRLGEIAHTALIGIGLGIWCIGGTG